MKPKTSFKSTTCEQLSKSGTQFHFTFFYDAVSQISKAKGYAYNLRWLMRAVVRLGISPAFLRLLQAALSCLRALQTPYGPATRIETMGSSYLTGKLDHSKTLTQVKFLGLGLGTCILQGRLIIIFFNHGGEVHWAILKAQEVSSPIPEMPCLYYEIDWRLFLNLGGYILRPLGRLT